MTFPQALFSRPSVLALAIAVGIAFPALLPAEDKAPLDPVLAAASQPGLSSPRLFFSAADIPALREKARSGIAAEAAAELKKEADRQLLLPDDPFQPGDKSFMEDGSAGRGIQKVIWELTMQGYLSGDMRYIDKAIAMVMSLCRDYPIEKYSKDVIHLQIGDAALGYAVAYDWLYPFMTPEQRTALEKQVTGYAAWLRHDSEFGGKRQGPGGKNGDIVRSRMAHNHSIVMHGPILLAGLLFDNPEWVQYAKDRTKAYFKFSMDATGFGYEGAMYFGYGLHSAILGAVAYERQTGESLYQDSALSKVTDMMLYQLKAEGGSLLLVNQTAPAMRPATAWFYAINHFKDRVGLWAWQRLFGPEINPNFPQTSGHHQGCTTVPFVILWSDPNLQPESPQEAGKPPALRFEHGMVVMRDGWGAMDPLVSFRAAEAIPGIWNHPDGLSFTFQAYGEDFSTDPGSHLYQTDQHSTVLVNGKGQAWQGPGNAVKSIITAFEDRGDSVFTAGDATEAYRSSINNERAGLGIPIERARRKILYIRQPQPCLIIADDFQMQDGAEHEYTWQMVTGDRAGVRNTIALKDSGATITGGRHGAICEITFVSPENLTLGKRKTEKYGLDILTATSRAVNPRFTAVLATSPAGTPAPQVSTTPLTDQDKQTITLTFPDGTAKNVLVSKDNIQITP